MRILKSKFIRKVGILGFSLTIAIVSILVINTKYNLLSEVTGSLAGFPLLIPNKFCENPSTQPLCQKFISTAIAQAAPTTFQTVSGPVAISGKLGFEQSLFAGGSKLTLYENTSGGAVYGFGITGGSLDVYSGVSDGTKAMGIRSDGHLNIPRGVIQNGDTAVGTNDLGLYSQGAGNWMRFVTNNAPFKWYADNGTGTNAKMTLNTDGSLLATGEIQSNMTTGSGQFRAVGGNYGTIFRQDGDNFYILTTASGSQYGSWNTLRPFYINNASGYVTFGNGHADASDARLKNNIQPISTSFPDTLSTIEKLQGVSFNRKSDPNRTAYGFVAQQVEKILPNLVREDSLGYKSLDYDGILPFVIESIKQLIQKLNLHTTQINELQQAIKEQQQKIDQLKQEIQELKNK